jgi:hypothetical protein
VGERDAAAAAIVGDTRVFGQRRTIPQREHHGARLEEDNVLALGLARPTECFVEGSSAREVVNTQRHQRDSLLHAPSMPSRAGVRRRCARTMGVTIARIPAVSVLVSDQVRSLALCADVLGSNGR